MGMKHIFLALTVFALLFNTAVAAASDHNCVHHKTATTQAQKAEKPCHDMATKADTKTENQKMADNSCCGKLCMCVAKATLKTLDVPAALGFLAQKTPADAVVAALATNVNADLSHTAPPPKSFV